MLAYSSIAHAGFVLVGVIALVQDGIGSVLFYLLAYGLATVGAFAVVTLVRERDAAGTVTGEALHLSQWAGLGRRSPALALAMTLFLLRSEEHTSELQSRENLVCRLLLEKKKNRRSNLLE